MIRQKSALNLNLIIKFVYNIRITSAVVPCETKTEGLADKERSYGQTRIGCRISIHSMSNFTNTYYSIGVVDIVQSCHYALNVIEIL